MKMYIGLGLSWDTYRDIYYKNGFEVTNEFVMNRLRDIQKPAYETNILSACDWIYKKYKGEA
jgi:hypothetical protein